MDLAAVLVSELVVELDVVTLVPALTAEMRTYPDQSHLEGTAASGRTEKAAPTEMLLRHLQLEPMTMGLQWTEPNQLRPQDRHRQGKDVA